VSLFNHGLTTRANSDKLHRERACHCALSFGASYENGLSLEISATLQYAGLHLETPLFVVLGHEGCGAITSALATKHEGAQFRSRIQLLLATILPGLPELDLTLSPEEQTSRAVESNVRWTVRQILDASEGKARMAEGE
jgi:carbonic anhydrase